MAAAGRRVHAADPGAEREAHDGERASLVGAKAVVEDLLEAACDGELVGDEARPERRLAGRARGDGDHVARLELAPSTQLRQRVAAEVVRLVDQRDPRIEACKIID